MSSIQPKRIAPGPNRLTFIQDFRRSPLEALWRYNRKYGDVVRTTIRGQTYHFLFHPDHATRVLLTDRDDFVKQSRDIDKMRIFADGLFTSDGERWKTQRNIIQPLFGANASEGWFSMTPPIVERVVDRWAKENAQGCKILDLGTEMLTLTIRILNNTILGADVGPAEEEIVGEYLPAPRSYYMSLLVSPFDVTEKLPTKKKRAYLRAREKMDGLIDRLIQRKRGDDRGTDLLSRLTRARDEETNAALNEEEIAAQIRMFFIGGTETTAHTLTFAFYLVAMHPEVARKVREELDRELGDAPINSREQVERLVYTRAIFLEAMRLYPSLWKTSRGVARDVEVDGYHLPKGSILWVMIYHIQRRGEVWENPEAFMPERFLGNYPKSAYIPFGHGPRKCIGTPLAMIEGTVVLATALRRLRLHLVPGHSVVAAPQGTLHPRDGVQMTVHPV
jgi:enediyne biosynthesis protein E7